MARGLSLVSRSALRILASFVVIVGVVSASFFAMDRLPGDAARAVMGPQASEAEVVKLRARYGMDASLSERYVRYLGRVVHLSRGADAEHRGCAKALGLHVDLGTSHVYRRPVVELLEKRAIVSIKLALIAVFFQLLVGLSLGIHGARASARGRGALSLGAMMVLSALPTFVVGLLLQYVFAHRLSILPYDGLGRTPSEAWRGLLLPGLTLGAFSGAFLARLVREAMLRELQEPYVRLARAKGASSARVVWVHAFRVALAPLATLSALELGALIGGAALVEKLFRIPGLGELAVTALQNRDVEAATGATLVTASFVVIATLVADALSATLDPRRRS